MPVSKPKPTRKKKERKKERTKERKKKAFGMLAPSAVISKPARCTQ
jgi:hypothetical protein